MSEYGPAWQLKQQINHYEALALTSGKQAEKNLKEAEQARKMAQEYKDALAKLNE